MAPIRATVGHGLVPSLADAAAVPREGEGARPMGAWGAPYGRVGRALWARGARPMGALGRVLADTNDRPTSVSTSPAYSQDSASVAIPSTRKNPHMSVTVVSTGPEATAGSRPHALQQQRHGSADGDRNHGIDRERECDHDAQGGISLSRPRRPHRARRRAQGRSGCPPWPPATTPAAASRGVTTPKVNSRMLTATAWLPEHPLMSETIGRNTASTITAARVSSKAAMTLTESMFSTMLMDSPRQPSAGAFGERHAAQLFAADDALRLQVIVGGTLHQGVVDVGALDHAEHVAGIVRYRQRQDFRFLEAGIHRGPNPRPRLPPSAGSSMQPRPTPAPRRRDHAFGPRPQARHRTPRRRRIEEGSGTGRAPRKVSSSRTSRAVAEPGNAKYWRTIRPPADSAG